MIPIKLFDQCGENGKVDVHVNPHAIDHLYRAVEPYLPERYRSMEGMAAFFEDLADVFHAAETMAIDNEKAYAYWRPVHINFHVTDTLSRLVKMCAYQAKSGFRNDDTVKQLHAAYNNDAVADFYNQGCGIPSLIDQPYMRDGLRTTAQTLQNYTGYLASTKQFATEKAYAVLMHKDNYVEIYRQIRSDGGLGITQLLKVVADALEHEPLVSVKEKHIAREEAGQFRDAIRQAKSGVVQYK